LPTELFRTNDFLVRAVSGFGSSTCMVCFDGLQDVHTLDRPGFGERFFAQAAVDAIHFVIRDNAWYQYEQMEEALDRVAVALASYDRVLTYGSSMGGYAAIRFGGRLKADTAVATSPQYSIDARVVPFETRWRDEAKRLDFKVEARFSSGFARRSYVFYDPYDPDNRHVDLYRGHTDVIDVRILGCGHSSIGYLAEAGLLPECALSLIQGTFDAVSFSLRARQRRRWVAQRYLVLADRSRLLRTRIALVRKAREIKPDEVPILIKLGNLLEQDRQFSEAADCFARAAQIASDHPLMRDD